MTGTPPEDDRLGDPDSPTDLFADPAEPSGGHRPAPSAPCRRASSSSPRPRSATAIRSVSPCSIACCTACRRSRDLLAVRSDPDVEKLYRRADAVRRDAHKMKAFVRFKSIVDD